MIVDPQDLQREHDHDHDCEMGPGPVSAQPAKPNLPTPHHPTIVCFPAVNRLHTDGGMPNSSLCADPLSVPGPVAVEDKEEEEASISDNGNKLSLVSSVPALLPQPSSDETGSGHSRMFVDEDGDALPLYHTPVKTPSAHPAAVGVGSIKGFLASEHCVIDPGVCVQCVKCLETIKDHTCVQLNLQHKCEYCMHLKKPCETIPHHYHVSTRVLVKSLHNNTFLEQASCFAAELEMHLQHCVPKNDNIHALWLLNQNLFQLVNTLCASHSWEPLPADQEEVEEEFFGGSMEGV